MPTTPELGCGLIGIGRTWGHTVTEIPNEHEVIDFLDTAFERGIRFFDTAPSYGLSELRFGKWLQGLNAADRATIKVATKFGEHWSQDGEPYADHTYDALVRSIDQSLERLDGKVDVLQLHKTTPSVLASDAVLRAIEYARSVGIETIGASVSDLESAVLVGKNPTYSVIQMPYNTSNTTFEDSVRLAKSEKKMILLNRPLNMGNHSALLANSQRRNSLLQDAFSHILQLQFFGYVLTGTKSIRHLDQNIAAFTAAQEIINAEINRS